MSKQPVRGPGTVTDAQIQDLCGIAKIPQAGRAAFATDFRVAIAKATRRGKDYESPDAAAPIITDAKSVSAAANALFHAIEKCGAETRSLIEGMLLDGTTHEIELAVGKPAFVCEPKRVPRLSNCKPLAGTRR